MSEEELLKFAEGVAAQRIVVQNLGMVNTPSDVAERVKLDARYMVEQDKLAILEKGYHAALRMFTDSTRDGTSPTVYVGGYARNA